MLRNKNNYTLEQSPHTTIGNQRHLYFCKIHLLLQAASGLSIICDLLNLAALRWAHTRGYVAGTCCRNMLLQNVAETKSR